MSLALSEAQQEILDNFKDGVRVNRQELIYANIGRSTLPEFLKEHLGYTGTINFFADETGQYYDIDHGQVRFNFTDEPSDTPQNQGSHKAESQENQALQDRINELTRLETETQQALSEKILEGSEDRSREDLHIDLNKVLESDLISAENKKLLEKYVEQGETILTGWDLGEPEFKTENLTEQEYKTLMDEIDKALSFIDSPEIFSQFVIPSEVNEMHAHLQGDTELLREQREIRAQLEQIQSEIQSLRAQIESTDNTPSADSDSNNAAYSVEILDIISHSTEYEGDQGLLTKLQNSGLAHNVTSPEGTEVEQETPQNLTHNHQSLTI